MTFGKMNHDLQHKGFNADRVMQFVSGGELWQGGYPPVDSGYLRREGFDVVVLAAEEFQPQAARFGPGIAVIHAPNYDAPLESGGDISRAVEASREVARAIRNGKKVLVTCAAGLNRSGLITALSILRLTRLPGEKVIAAIRKARGPWAMSNEDFEKAVLEVARLRDANVVRASQEVANGRKANRRSRERSTEES